MNQERWQQITGIFEAALKRDPASRAAFVAEACPGDDDLRQEVEAMLSSHERAGGFIESPAMEVAARQGGSRVSLTGTTIAHYQLLSLLGSGGMGDVYLALDTKLGRRVALKLLPEYLAGDSQRARMFTKEARAASALNHPNIVTIHEIGQLGERYYIAMEYIEGATLGEKIHRQPAPLEKLLKYLEQVAEGLTKAHDAGIVHRDLKPDNIMITSDGYAKILDFGLAKLVEQQRPGAAEPSEANTALIAPTSIPGMVMGTLGYMSPEQAQGKSSEIDHRSDIFSFGCILYEAVTSQRAFEGKDVLDSLHKIVHAPAPSLLGMSPQAPPELERIVRRCLAKDPEKRYQSIKDVAIELEEVRRDLKGETGTLRSASSEPAQPGAVTNVAAAASTNELTAPPTSSAEYLVGEVKRHKRVAVLAVVGFIAVAVAGYFYFVPRGRAINSLAVVPLVNATGDPNTEYLSEGITENLIDNLSQLPRLRVMSLNSVLRYKGREVDAQTIGRELGVEAVVTGRVVQRGDGLVVSVEMVKVSDNSRLWGGRYDRKLSDLLAVQGEISREVVEKLRLRLTGEQENRAAKRYTQNTEAYQLYLRGRYHWNRRAVDDLWKGLENFQRAIELDPNFALAWAGLADCYVTMVLGAPFGPTKRPPMPLAEVRTKWGPAARRAVELDPNSSEVHSTLGKGLEWLDWDLAGAEREYKRALELNPDDATAHHRYGVFLVVSGRTDEGFKELNRALELDPASLPVNADLGGYYCSALRDPDRGIRQLKKTIELAPDWPRAHFFLSNCYAEKGMWNEALQELQSIGSPGVVPLARMYARTGKRDEALKIVAEMKEREKKQLISPQAVANIYAALGDKDQAFEWLEKAYTARAPTLRGLKIGTAWDPLRGDPRFTDLLKRIGLPP
jgi:eukaryotic-like serine/threonine-protein kinase